MITNATAMACGNCGNGLFRMFTDKDKDDLFDLFAECTNCKSVSVISVTTPRISINEVEHGSPGILCQMDPTMNKVV